MRKSLLSAAVVILAAAPLAAQRISNHGLELRPYAGAYVPLTAHRREVKDAVTFGAQAAYELGDYFHVVWTFGWTDVETRLGLSENAAFIVQYDFGGEANLLYQVAKGWYWRPFVGAGGGGRTYDYSGAVTSRSCLAGYGSLGGELQNGVFAIHLEARDYLTCFKAPISGARKTRNDALFTAAVALHLR